jgi:hypothetical protein
MGGLVKAVRLGEFCWVKQIRLGVRGIRSSSSGKGS